jgi:hypothetical protein
VRVRVCACVRVCVCVCACVFASVEPQEGLQYKKPTLFVGGAKSGYIKPEYHEQIRAFFPKAKIAMIEVCVIPPACSPQSQFLPPRPMTDLLRTGRLSLGAL